MTKKLYRIPSQGKIAGVAAGFAEYFDMDVTLMRLLFVAALLLTGGAVIVVYIIFAFILPVEGRAKDGSFDEKVETIAEEMKTNGGARNAGNYTGAFLVLLGAWLLLGQFFPVVFNLQWSVIWPCLVILLGLWIITKGRK
jgi:phage shock protein PspC (stress-responsive transcriptional regulator)